MDSYSVKRFIKSVVLFTYFRVVNSGNIPATMKSLLGKVSNYSSCSSRTLTYKLQLYKHVIGRLFNELHNFICRL